MCVFLTPPQIKEDGSESDSVVASPSSTGSKSNTPTSSVPSATVTPLNEPMVPSGEFDMCRGRSRKNAKRLSRNMEVQVSQETRNVSIGEREREGQENAGIAYVIVTVSHIQSIQVHTRQDALWDSSQYYAP